MWQLVNNQMCYRDLVWILTVHLQWNEIGNETTWKRCRSKENSIEVSTVCRGPLKLYRFSHLMVVDRETEEYLQGMHSGVPILSDCTNGEWSSDFFSYRDITFMKHRQCAGPVHKEDITKCLQLLVWVVTTPNNVWIKWEHYKDETQRHKIKVNSTGGIRQKEGVQLPDNM